MTILEIIRAWERKQLPLHRQGLDDIRQKLQEACYQTNGRLDASQHQLVRDYFTAELAVLRKIEGTVDFLLHEVLPGIEKGGTLILKTTPVAETTMVPDRSQLACEYDTILCPNCGHEQRARVVVSGSNETFAHECRKCKFTITKENWNSILTH